MQELGLNKLNIADSSYLRVEDVKKLRNGVIVELVKEITSAKLYDIIPNLVPENFDLPSFDVIRKRTAKLQNEIGKIRRKKDQLKLKLSNSFDLLVVAPQTP